MNRGRRTTGLLMCVLAVFHAATLAAGVAEPSMPQGVKRIVFLGDSITYAGGYTQHIEAQLLVHLPGRRFEIINIGLPSETASGLSEPGHADGKFPRPSVHDRLSRALEKTRPDLVIACYGMNDGIYMPFDEDRFAAYRAGIEKLVEQAKATGARVMLLTPPPFDPVPIQQKTSPTRPDGPFEGYDQVLGRYSQWLLEQRRRGWVVVDLHGPMNRHVAEQRRTNPTYALAGDGVHTNALGHWLMAREVLAAWRIPTEEVGRVEELSIHRKRPELLKRIGQRQRIVTDAYLTEIGHSRPGMNKGLPLDEALRKAAELDESIR